MCMTCGCMMPEDSMGNADNITLERDPSSATMTEKSLAVCTLRLCRHSAVSCQLPQTGTMTVRRTLLSGHIYLQGRETQAGQQPDSR